MEGANYFDLIAEGKVAGAKSMLHYTPPGAETIEQFDSRAMDFFCEICKYVSPWQYHKCALLYSQEGMHLNKGQKSCYYY